MGGRLRVGMVAGIKSESVAGWRRNPQQDDVNLAGLTVAAITNDYAADGRVKREEAAVRAAAKERAKAERVERESRETAEREARKREINARLEAMPAEERQALRAAFITEVAAGRHGEALAGAYRRRGWKAIEASFRLFATIRLHLPMHGDH